MLVPRGLELAGHSLKSFVDVENNELLVCQTSEEASWLVSLRAEVLVMEALPGLNGEWLPDIDTFRAPSRSWNLSGDYIDLRLMARGEDPIIAEAREYKFYELAVLSLAGLPEIKVQPDFYVAEQEAKEAKKKQKRDRERAIANNPKLKEKFDAEDAAREGGPGSVRGKATESLYHAVLWRV